MATNLTEFVPLRVSVETRVELEEIAKRWNVSRSAVMRIALSDFLCNDAITDIARVHLKEVRLSSND